MRCGHDPCLAIPNIGYCFRTYMMSSTDRNILILYSCVLRTFRLSTDRGHECQLPLIYFDRLLPSNRCSGSFGSEKRILISSPKIICSHTQGQDRDASKNPCLVQIQHTNCIYNLLFSLAAIKKEGVIKTGAVLRVLQSAVMLSPKFPIHNLLHI